jgi:hypothetical protein
MAAIGAASVITVSYVPAADAGDKPTNQPPAATSAVPSQLAASTGPTETPSAVPGPAGAVLSRATGLFTPPAPPPPPPTAPAAAPAPPPPPADTVTPDQRAAWERVALCEEGGNWQASGSRFSGGLGITRSNWAAYGGEAYAPEAAMATEDQQIMVAERIEASPPDREGCRGW